jgi:hypothetical protein
VAVESMRCANPECRQLLLRIKTWRSDFHEGGVTTHQDASAWLAHPRIGALERELDPNMPADLRRDYEEATAILPFSPRMSAVLSRRLLFELLGRYGKITGRTLQARLGKFTKSTKHPPRVREPLHRLSEVGEFSAPRLRGGSEATSIVDVGVEDAEWTLNVVGQLFEYFLDADREQKVTKERPAGDVLGP